mgnify:FL=1
MAYVISDDCIACGTCIVQMFVLLKQFIRENNTILRKRRKARFQ